MTSPVQIPPDDPAMQRSLARWMAAGVVLLALLVAAFPGYRAVEAGRREDALKSRRAALVAQGRQLWAANCSSCHGDSGEGPDAPALNSHEFFAAASDKQIHHVVEGGVPGTDMPAWWNEFGGPLTEDQIRGIVAYVESWAATAPSRPDWRNPAGGG